MVFIFPHMSYFCMRLLALEVTVCQCLFWKLVIQASTAVSFWTHYYKSNPSIGNPIMPQVESTGQLRDCVSDLVSLLLDSRGKTVNSVCIIKNKRIFSINSLVKSHLFLPYMYAVVVEPIVHQLLTGGFYR